MILASDFNVVYRTTGREVTDSLNNLTNIIVIHPKSNQNPIWEKSLAILTLFSLVFIDYTQYRIDDSDKDDGITAVILNISLYGCHIFSSLDRLYMDKLFTWSGELYPAADKLYGSAGKLYTSAEKLHTAAEKLYNSAEKLHAAAGKLYVSAGKLHASAEKLHASANKLYTSAGKLHAAAEKLHSSAGKLYTSAKKLYSSAGVLNTSAITKWSSNDIFFISALNYYFVLSHKIKKYIGGKK